MKETGRGIICGTILALAWKDWGKPRKNSPESQSTGRDLNLGTSQIRSPAGSRLLCHELVTYQERIFKVMEKNTIGGTLWFALLIGAMRILKGVRELVCNARKGKHISLSYAK